MKKLSFIVFPMLVLLAMVSPASALFVNGGFETGDYTGWTVTGAGSGTGASRIDIIDDTATMDYQSIDVNPYNGTYMARIGDVYGDYDSTKLSQTDTISQQDIDDGAVLYVNWGAILVDPVNNPHGDADTPFFSIDVTVNGAPAAHFERLATDHTLATAAGNYGASTGGEMWYWAGTWSFDLAAYSVDDVVGIDLYVEDCGWGGHGGYAFLDGIGTIDPGNHVPVPPAVLLMGTGMFGLGIFRKMFRKV
jgi:hypothetical protein